MQMQSVWHASNVSTYRRLMPVNALQLNNLVRCPPLLLFPLFHPSRLSSSFLSSANFTAILFLGSFFLSSNKLLNFYPILPRFSLSLSLSALMIFFASLNFALSGLYNNLIFAYFLSNSYGHFIRRFILSFLLSLIFWISSLLFIIFLFHHSFSLSPFPLFLFPNFLRIRLSFS